MMKSRPIIAVDIDDVILAETAFIVKYSNEKWGHTLTHDDYIEDWREMWGVDDEELQKRIKVLHAPGVQTSYDLIDGAYQTLMQLAHRFKLVVLSSRRETVRQETIDWVNTHLPNIFDEFYFTGFWDSGKKDAHLLTKGELVKSIGAAYLIDDQPKHCFAAAEAGVAAVLFGDYGVSRHLSLPQNVTRCKDWAAVARYFEDEPKRRRWVTHDQVVQ